MEKNKTLTYVLTLKLKTENYQECNINNLSNIKMEV